MSFEFLFFLKFHFSLLYYDQYVYPLCKVLHLAFLSNEKYDRFIRKYYLIFIKKFRSKRFF
jgi:hypothetical protein